MLVLGKRRSDMKEGVLPQKNIPLKSQRNAEKRMLKDLININRNSPFDEIRRRILEGGLLRDSNLSPNMTTPEESLPNLA